VQILFVIQSPDVFKSPNSDTYIIFGEVSMGHGMHSFVVADTPWLSCAPLLSCGPDLQAKIEDLSAQAQTQAAEQFTRRPETEQIQSKATVGKTTSME
jgi:nascent polypeptide-associated complex subunit alpha